MTIFSSVVEAKEKSTQTLTQHILFSSPLILWNHPPSTQPTYVHAPLFFTFEPTGCDIPVHQDCYGVDVVPSGNWYCQRCEDRIPVMNTVRETEGFMGKFNILASNLSIISLVTLGSILTIVCTYTNSRAVAVLRLRELSSAQQYPTNISTQPVHASTHVWTKPWIPSNSTPRSSVSRSAVSAKPIPESALPAVPTAAPGPCMLHAHKNTIL